MGWIVTIWVKLARLTGEKKCQTTKMKYKITKKSWVIGEGKANFFAITVN